MIKKLKKSIQMLSVAFNSILLLCRVIAFSRSHNIKFKNKEKCYILGLGPSLKKDIIGHEESLSQSSLFVVNDYIVRDPVGFVRLHPENYLLADPIYWGSDLNEFVELRNKIFSELLEKTSW